MTMKLSIKSSRKSRKSSRFSRKSRKSSRKSRKSSRKSRKSSRKSRKSSRKSRKSSRKSRKSRKSSRKSRKSSRKSRKSSRKSRKSDDTSTIQNFTIKNRVENAISIKKNINLKGEQCIHNKNDALLEKIEIIDMIGVGTFGEVYQVETNNSTKIALKVSKFLSKKDVTKVNSQSWFELTILRDYIRPLIEHKICPNLPLLIDGYFCSNCKFRNAKDQACIITLMELANGDLHDWFNKKKRTDDELYNALFQIMVAIHAIHTHHQIINLDVKAQNVLYHEVAPGGHWVYIVNGVNYYVPNLGFLMVLNDFGVSMSQEPTSTDINKIPFTTFRNYMIINDRISPFQSTVYWIKKEK